mgnify:CR=1 FL=1
MKTKNLYILALAMLIAIAGWQCSETVSTSEDARLVTETELVKIPGYDWYTPVKLVYYPDPDTILAIKDEFDSSRHSFLVFSMPACACDNNQKLFPKAMKVLDTSGISMKFIEMYTVKNNKTKHPYDSLITLRFIPTIILMKDGKPVYSIIDSVIDQSIANYTIEGEILRALRK